MLSEKGRRGALHTNANAAHPGTSSAYLVPGPRAGLVATQEPFPCTGDPVAGADAPQCRPPQVPGSRDYYTTSPGRARARRQSVGRVGELPPFTRC